MDNIEHEDLLEEERRLTKILNFRPNVKFYFTALERNTKLYLAPVVDLKTNSNTKLFYL